MDNAQDDFLPFARALARMVRRRLAAAEPPENPPAPDVHIYALRDPRTRQTRYIGQAVDLRTRLTAHLSSAARGAQSKKDAWLRELFAAGLCPEMVLLETVDGAAANAAEQRHIALAREGGAPLLNRLATPHRR